MFSKFKIRDEVFLESNLIFEVMVMMRITTRFPDYDAVSDLVVKPFPRRSKIQYQ